jgi:hypothetical protein
MLGEDWIYEEFLKSFTANKYDSPSKVDEIDSKKRKLSSSAKRINFVWPTGIFIYLITKYS